MKHVRFQTDSVFHPVASLAAAKSLVRSRYPKAKFAPEPDDERIACEEDGDLVAEIRDKPACELCDNKRAGFTHEHSASCQAQYAADTATASQPK